MGGRRPRLPPYIVAGMRPREILTKEGCTNEIVSRHCEPDIPILRGIVGGRRPRLPLIEGVAITLRRNLSSRFVSPYPKPQTSANSCHNSPKILANIAHKREIIKNGVDFIQVMEHIINAPLENSHHVIDIGAVNVIFGEKM